ncbi:O-antigen polymerase [Rossellomorea marisflavi]|uniref:O-antigen polymerase n=1 Tax=Rossellomorea marisflavi TaxID=189381 RepID=UPI00345C9D77
MNEFLNITIVVECIIFNFINFILFGKRLNINKAQNYVWMFAYLVYLSGYFQYYDLSIEVYIYSFTYILVFNVIYIIFGKKFNISTESLKTSILNSIENSRHNIRILGIVSVVCWIITIPLLIKSLPILISSSMNMLRYIVYGENSIYSTLDMMIIQYFVRPIYSITIILSAVMLTVRRYNKSFFLITIINAIMYSLLTSGRALFMQIIIYVALSLWFFYGNNIGKLFKLYKKIIIPSSIIVIAIFWVSSLRVNRSYGVIGEFVIYMTSSLPYLSILLDSGKVESYSLFGRGFLSFGLDSIGLVVRLFGINVPLASQTVSEITLDSLYVSPTIFTNAIATTLLDFLLEAGFIGVVIGAVISGLIAVNAENYFYKTMTTFSYILYLFILQMMFFSIQFYGLGKPSVFFIVFFMFIFIRKPMRGFVQRK